MKSSSGYQLHTSVPSSTVATNESMPLVKGIRWTSTCFLHPTLPSYRTAFATVNIFDRGCISDFSNRFATDLSLGLC